MPSGCIKETEWQLNNNKISVEYKYSQYRGLLTMVPLDFDLRKTQRKSKLLQFPR